MIHAIGALPLTIAQTFPQAPAPTPGTPAFTLNPIIVLFGGVFFGVVAMLIWRNKGGEAWVGFLWGFFLGLIGLIVVAVANPAGRRRVPMVATAQTQSWQRAAPPPMPSRSCPHCGQLVQADQGTCPSCGQTSEPWRNQNGVWVSRNAGREWWLNPQTNTWQMLRINKFCPSCRAEMTPEQAVCPECLTASNTLGAPAS